MGAAAVMGLVCGLVWPATAAAQASITGTVRDGSGAALPGVTVEASSPALIEQRRVTVTDDTGRYGIVDLRPGAYAVTFNLAGFATVTRAGIELTGSFVATVNATLAVRGAGETIHVTAGVPALDARNTRQQASMTAAIVADIPTGRSLANLGVLIPGMTTVAVRTQNDVGGTNNLQNMFMAIHGGRVTDQRVYVDGITIRNLQSEGQASNFTPDMSSAEEVTIDYAGMTAVLAVAAVILAETGLIVGLVLQGARRRRAEARAHAAATELRASYDRIRDLGGRLIGAQEAERARIARDLHDDISQQLTLLRIDLDVIAAAHRNGDDALSPLSRDVLEHERSRQERAPALAPASPREAPVHRAGRGAECAAARDPCNRSTDRLQPRARAAAHPSGSDALPLSHRAGGAAERDQVQRREPDHHPARGIPRRTHVSVADDGVGFDVAAAGGGLGSISMRERLEPFGGVLHIRSDPGRGACIEAVVPAPSAAAVETAPAEIA